jgi:branched-chain amino acid transport system ATP-binding protein
MLEVNNIDVSYDGLKVLRDISLEVEKNHAVAIVGPNAAGKTTTFKTIVGLLKPDNGSIHFEGKKIDGRRADEILAEGIALVPEGRLLFPDLSVRENLEMGAKIRGGIKNAQDTLEWVLNMFPILEERTKQMAGSLSGGEQQMLAIGRALMSDPKLLLLDEPSQGLAPMLVERVFEAMDEIGVEGKSVLISEQNVRLALDFCDDAYILENGRIAMKGKGCDLIDDDYIRESYLGL